jgi:hypothetical protein
MNARSCTVRPCTCAHKIAKGYKYKKPLKIKTEISSSLISRRRTPFFFSPSRSFFLSVLLLYKLIFQKRINIKRLPLNPNLRSKTIKQKPHKLNKKKNRMEIEIEVNPFAVSLLLSFFFFFRFGLICLDSRLVWVLLWIVVLMNDDGDAGVP